MRIRCGASRCAFQIRCTERSETPATLAIIRPVQCVASPGGSPRVNPTTRSTMAGRQRRRAGLPGLVAQQAGDALLRPCCTDQRGGHIDPNSRRGSCDADRLRASELEHAVQSTNGDRDFCGLTIVCARTERIADHPFVARDRRLRLGPGVVAGSLLPAHTATFGDQLQMPVALGGLGRGGLTRHRARARWHNDGRLGMALGDRRVHVPAVIGTVAGERGDRHPST